MKYEEAKTKCHIRSAIYRKSNPDIKYWKNYPVSLDERVKDKSGDDWVEYDPREHNTSSYNETPA